MSAHDRLISLSATTIQRFGREAAVWALTLFLMRAFLGAGYLKLLDASGWTAAFTEWGYPAWFRRVVGISELAGGILILWPRSAAYGALTIFGVMVGAIATHFRAGEYMDAYTSDLPSFCFSAALILARWPATARQPAGTES
jgi:uncharacterized membrane protein YphA (DoxX/SURF4 family)